MLTVRRSAGRVWLANKRLEHLIALEQRRLAMSTELTPDLCVIGGGPGGVTAALGAASAGKSVVLVEKNTLGGRRLSEAIPRHSWLAASREADKARRVMNFTVNAQQPQIDFARLRQETAAIVAAVAPNYSQARLEAMNINVIRASGRFVRADTCEAGGANIRARRFIIATGAVPRRLLINGLDTIQPLDCAALCALDHPPERLIVIGADPDGLALAQAVRRLGSEVVIVSGEPLFAGEDEELAAPVRAAFGRDGIAIHEGVRLARIEPRGAGVRALLAAAGRESQVLGSHVFLAAGSLPAVEGMGLAAAGVRYDLSGITTSARLVTSNWRIHAIGAAVKGAPQEGAAEWHAVHVLRAILELPGAVPVRQATARVVWTSPPIAVAGISEAQARSAHRHICVLRWPLAETERAQIERQPGGHVKLITTPAGAILGAGIVGAGADELITPFTLAISKRMTARDIAGIMCPYPAMANAVRSAGLTFQDNQPELSMSRLLQAGAKWIERQSGEFRELAAAIAEKTRRLFR
jgi:pyruvate/2-oxoglutarate dehydrogenase complex dihydrolipoamide dehydrogenase (E3) component